MSIGNAAGYQDQNIYSIAIGRNAGRKGQYERSIAIGPFAARDHQGERSISIGNITGQFNQGNDAIGIGSQAAYQFQNNNAIAIGTETGKVGQAKGAVAIGVQAGKTGQRENAVAIGKYAGRNNQVGGSIILNGSGTDQDASNVGFYVNPIRSVSYTSNILAFNTGDNEVCLASNVGIAGDIVANAFFDHTGALVGSGGGVSETSSNLDTVLMNGNVTSNTITLGGWVLTATQ